MTRGKADRRRRGLTLIEVMVALAVLTLMITSVWSSFRGTLRGLETTEKIQERYATVRTGLARIASELSMAYLSFNRPPEETRHFSLFEGRDSFDSDSVTFSAYTHLRIRRDANESDQSLIQYFLQKDPEDSSRTHLYRRETRRLTGDLPENLQNYAPAYVLLEDVSKLDFKYWDPIREEWVEEWATMRTDMQPDRLPPRIKITVGVQDIGEGAPPIEFSTQTVLFMQEKIDLSRAP